MLIYVIREIDGDFCKIGVTDNIQRRFINLSRGNPRKLEVVYSLGMMDSGRSRERAAHDLLEKRFHRSGEWFRTHYLKAIAALNIVGIRERTHHYRVPTSRRLRRELRRAVRVTMRLHCPPEALVDVPLPSPPRMERG